MDSPKTTMIRIGEYLVPVTTVLDIRISGIRQNIVSQN